MTQCKGMNCGTTTGSHSPECRAEHAAAVAGGRFVKGDAAGEFVGYYWIGDDNHQKFCGSYDTICVETAARAQKVYTAPCAASGQKLTELVKAIKAARSAALVRLDADSVNEFGRLLLMASALQSDSAAGSDKESGNV